MDFLLEFFEPRPVNAIDPVIEFGFSRCKHGLLERVVFWLSTQSLFDTQLL